MAIATFTPIERSSSLNGNPTSGLTVADAVWIGMALLHYARPGQAQFSKQEVVDSVINHSLTKADIKSIKQHVSQHCVAKCKPQPNRSRVLHETADTHRKLFVEGVHPYHPARAGSPTHPAWQDLPQEYAYLRQWYEEYCLTQKSDVGSTSDPLLALVGAGSEVWKDEPADEYVANLRTGWEGRS